MIENPGKSGFFRGRDIAFDIGNVLLDFDFKRAVRGIAGSRERAAEVLAYFSRTTLADLFERGLIDPREFHAQAAADLGLSMGFEEFRALWNDIFTPAQGMEELVGRLASRYRIHAATNTNTLHKAHILAAFPVCRHFAKIVASCDVGRRKPQREFYERLALEIAADPADILFVDDLDVNVAGARVAGLRALKFTSAEALRIDLAGLGVEEE